jgi:hypothetical protein
LLPLAVDVVRVVVGVVDLLARSTSPSVSIRYQVGVLRCELVPALTVGLRKVPSLDRVATKDVFALCNRPDVGRVHAVPALAGEVVEDKTFLDGRYLEFVDNPMCVSRSPSQVELAVSGVEKSSSPDPAWAKPRVEFGDRTILVNLAPEALLPREARGVEAAVSAPPLVMHPAPSTFLWSLRAAANAAFVFHETDSISAMTGQPSREGAI